MNTGGVDVFSVLLKLRDQYAVKALFEAYEKCLLTKHAELEKRVQNQLDGEGIYGHNPLPEIRKERSDLEQLPSWVYFENERRLKIGEKHKFSLPADLHSGVKKI